MDLGKYHLVIEPSELGQYRVDQRECGFKLRRFQLTEKSNSPFSRPSLDMKRRDGTHIPISRVSRLFRVKNILFFSLGPVDVILQDFHLDSLAIGYRLWCSSSDFDSVCCSFHIPTDTRKTGVPCRLLLYSTSPRVSWDQTLPANQDRPSPSLSWLAARNVVQGRGWR